MIMVLLLLLLSCTQAFSFLDPPDSAGLPHGCAKADGIAPRTPEICALYHSDAFLHNDTVRAVRSVQLMDSYPVALTAYSQPNVDRFRKLYRKLTQPQPVNTTINVLVFGGSLTSGSHIGAHNTWPARLEGMLRKRHATYRVNVFNRAEGGTTGHWALNRLNALFMDLGDTSGGGSIPGDSVNTLDLAIVDYDVNDCAVFGDSKGDREKMLAITEVLVRRIMGHETRPAVMFFNIATMHKVRARLGWEGVGGGTRGWRRVR